MHPPRSVASRASALWRSVRRLTWSGGLTCDACGHPLGEGFGRFPSPASATGSPSWIIFYRPHTRVRLAWEAGRWGAIAALFGGWWTSAQLRVAAQQLHNGRAAVPAAMTTLYLVAVVAGIVGAGALVAVWMFAPEDVHGVVVDTAGLRALEVVPIRGGVRVTAGRVRRLARDARVFVRAAAAAAG